VDQRSGAKIPQKSSPSLAEPELYWVYWDIHRCLDEGTMDQGWFTGIT